jgi:hypothetical protein
LKNTSCRTGGAAAGFEKHQLSNRRSRRVVGRFRKLCFLSGGGACLLPQDKELGDWL